MISSQQLSFAGWGVGENDSVSDIAIVGAPVDLGATGLPGQRFAPDAIREAGVFDHENFRDPGLKNVNYAESGVLDWGNVEMVPGDYRQSLAEVFKFIKSISKQFNRLIVLGGDDGVNVPVLTVLAEKFGAPPAIIHLDAHCDWYPSHSDKRRDHGSWVRDAISDGVVEHVHQFGVRAVIPSPKHFGKTHGKVSRYPEDATGDEIIDLASTLIRQYGSHPVFLVIDMDVVDPAFAPGVAFPEPGGLTSREVRSIVRHLGHRVVGMSITEVTPQLDEMGFTSLLANRMVLDFVYSVETKAKDLRLG